MPIKKQPKEWTPPGIKLTTVSNYAKEINLCVPRIYQQFQEGKIVIVKIDGRQYVKRDNNIF